MTGAEPREETAWKLRRSIRMGDGGRVRFKERCPRDKQFRGDDEEQRARYSTLC